MFKFEDLNSYNGNNSYPCSNEDAQIHKSLIKNFNKADVIGGICGGGDIGFVSLLPNLKAKGKLLLIDHCYASMTGAMIKYLILERYKPAQIRKLFTEDGEKLFKLVEKLKNELPVEFQRTGQILVSYVRPYPAMQSDPHYYISHDLTRIWRDVSDKEIEEIQKKLHLITFLHGDLSDLFKKGPFDIIYTSNAMTFYGRDGKKTDVNKLKRSLKPGGHVLTTNHSGIIPGLKELKKISGMVGRPSTQRTSWQYLLLQKPSD